MAKDNDSEKSAPKRKAAPRKPKAEKAPAREGSAAARKIEMTSAEPAAPYEWSPSKKSAAASDDASGRRVIRPRREAPAARQESDTPDSYRATPQDEAPREAPRSEHPADVRDQQENNEARRSENFEQSEGSNSEHRDRSNSENRENSENRGGSGENNSESQQTSNEPRAEGTAPTTGASSTPSSSSAPRTGDRPGQQWRDRRGDRPGDRGNWGRGGQQQGGRYDRYNKQGQGGRGGRDFGRGGDYNRGGDRYSSHGQQGGGYRDQARPAPIERRPQPMSYAPAPIVETPTIVERLDGFPNWDLTKDLQGMEALARQIAPTGTVLAYHEIVALGALELLEKAKSMEIPWEGAPHRERLLTKILEQAFAKGLSILADATVDMVGDEAVLVFGPENYRARSNSPYLPKALVERYAIKRGTLVKVQLHPAREGCKMPIALMVLSIAGESPEKNLSITPFEELTPYYPTKRILLETTPDVKWDNFSMRITDLLTPVGFGQRGLIVAPPRTGKTVLMQGMANAIALNHPECHLIVLLVDERPEEVTDFKRMVRGEVVSSTFDEVALSHVHAAEIVIESARRRVERGQHVVILLDSITRLARAYNVLAGSSGKIMSGGVESNALQKPKRFFGSARNIEGGGSLTILGTALVDTGSKMDEVIFEEFKGTGNMELHLDRGLVDKRLFPAIALDRSGTRKEELLYHPDEMLKVYGLRRAMKGVPPLEAMEMLLVRCKKTRTNIEFLMGLSR